jgi:hypothetical protein
VAGKTGFDFPVNESGVASSSRGLVGDTVFAVIPNVQPFHTFAITLIVLLVSVTSARVTLELVTILFLSKGFHGETLDDTNLQILPDRSHLMWIYFLYVRLACPRESNLVGPHTVKVDPQLHVPHWL